MDDISLKDKSEQIIKKSGKKLMAGAAVASTLFSMGMGTGALDDEDKVDPELESHIATVELSSMNDNHIIDLGLVEEGQEEARKQTVLSFAGSVLFAPLWFIAHLISPLLKPVLHVRLLAGGLFVAVLVGLKLKYPDVPLKEIVSKKNVALIFAGIALLFIAIWLVPIFVPDIERYVHIAELVAGRCLFIYVILKIKVFRPKKARFEVVI